MLTAAHILNFTGMILLPVLLAFWLTRRLRLTWKLVLAGALTFIASQVVHIPLVLGFQGILRSGLVPGPEVLAMEVVIALVLGLLAGICEETARWVLFKFILKKARTWEEGVVVGIGHGGVEALLLGFAAAVGFVQLLAFRAMDPAAIPGVQPEQLDALRATITQYWSLPPFLALLGFVERISAICLHLSLSVIVLYALARGKPIWFWLAVLWHALVDAVAVFLVSRIHMLALEGIIGVMAVISLVILFRLRPLFPAPEPLPQPEEIPVPA